MRLRCDEIAPYGTPAFQFEVYLDGERLAKCIEADEERGWALCHATDALGNVLLTDDLQDTKKVEHRGKAELRRKKS